MNLPSLRIVFAQTALYLLVLCASSDCRAATIRVGTLTLPPALGNPYTAVGYPSTLALSAIFDGLTRFSPDGKLSPALATSWELLAPTVWRFHLRSGVQFHNAAPFNAAAAAASIKFLANPATAMLVAREFRGISEVRVVDNLTLDIVSRVPDPLLPQKLTVAAIVEPTSWATLGSEEFARRPIGTGSYRLEDWGKGNLHAVLTAAKASWRPPHVDRIEIVPSSEPLSRVQALTSGQFDIIVGLDPEDVSSLKGQGYLVYSADLPSVYAIAFRSVRPDSSPIKNALVREALNLAIDRQAIVRTLFKGLAKPASQGATAGVVGFNPELRPIPYDPDRAKALLTQAGYKNGFRLIIDLSPDSAEQAMYELIAENLRSIGVALQIRTIPFATWLSRYNSGEWGSEVDGFNHIWNTALFNDSQRPFEYFSCLKIPPFFCDPKTTEEIKVAAQEVDSAKRERELQNLQAEYLDLAPSVLLISRPILYATTKTVSAFEARVTDGNILLEDLQMSSQ